MNDPTGNRDRTYGPTAEQRRNLSEDQRAWAEHVLGELSEEEVEQIREGLERAVGQRRDAEEPEEEEH